jgi:hypothetical protein
MSTELLYIRPFFNIFRLNFVHFRLHFIIYAAHLSQTKDLTPIPTRLRRLDCILPDRESVGREVRLVEVEEHDEVLRRRE